MAKQNAIDPAIIVDRFDVHYDGTFYQIWDKWNRSYVMESADFPIAFKTESQIKEFYATFIGQGYVKNRLKGYVPIVHIQQQIA